MSRRRLDVEMVRRSLAESRSDAQRLVARGVVTVNGAPAGKSSRLVEPGDAVRLVGPRPRYVSRGGFKLESALTGFGVDPKGLRCLDVGSSTGGFTDCLLQRGAASVVAVDVGTNQLHERLRVDPRVRVHERLHVKDLDMTELGGPAALVVADLSFISLRRVVRPLMASALPGADLILLVKPQFEAGRAEASKGRGVITDPLVRRRTVDEVLEAYSDAGAAKMGEMQSPITGADGNVEFLVHLRTSTVAVPGGGLGPLPGRIDDGAGEWP
ncbi:MAG: TlyA family RNA methyltransferase [Microthrixaceae bacterium]